jgi:superfamily II DNA or RNA helicase
VGRRFDRSKKIAAALTQDKDLGRLEADHIKPYSKGGNSSVENCQLITSLANKTKGDVFMDLRKWQSDFVKRWDDRKRDAAFLLVAIPGSGKTLVSLHVAQNWMLAGADRRLIVVVPTDNLRMQWRDEASSLGLELQTKEFGTNFKDGFQGCVTTYHSVAKQPMLYRKLCHLSAPTMVILDEIHHCGDEASFGKGIKEGFESAREKLLLSGTPWKTDGAPIPFVRYDGDGFPIADFRYDYPDALNDEVVRYLVFNHAGGEIVFEDTGRVEEVHEHIAEDDASKRLRKLLDPAGDFVRQQVRDAHNKLTECRKLIPDAAGLVACIDKSHAERIATVIKDVTGCKPSVIVSDGEIANDTVKSFRNKKSEWLVAVRQVSEGTDIKRLQVLCYFTNYATEVFFRQIIGRVSRIREMGDGDFEAYVYLPADPRLIRYAKNIENAQEQALREQAERDSRDVERGECDFLPEAYSTRRSGLDVTLIGNRQYSKPEAELIERAAEAAGVSMEKMATGFDVWRNGDSGTSLTPPIGSSAGASLEESTDKLRSECNKLAYKLSRILDVKVEKIHGQFRSQLGSSQSKMNESQLRYKKTELRKRIAAALRG